MGQVERGEVSVGLVGHKDDSPNFEFKFLTSDRMALVAPPDHVLSRKNAATVDDLAAHPLVLREAGSGSRHCFERSSDRAGRSLAELRVALELGSNEAIKEAVHRGVGVAVILAARRVGPSGRVVGVDMTAEMVQKATATAKSTARSRRRAAPPAV